VAVLLIIVSLIVFVGLRMLVYQKEK
jgi:hypothetical protein